MKYSLPLIIILSFLLFLSANAQISEGFDDGDFTNNPAWVGTDTNFTVNSSLQLQLNDVGSAATSYLSTTNSIIDSAEWQFYVKLSFSPSSQNFGRVYLVADQADLSSTSLNGYFIQLGESGSGDAIELYKKNGSTETMLIAGNPGQISYSTNTLRVKVTRTSSGVWNVYADTTGGTNFLAEGTATDASITTASYFGVLCTYTSSNATKFYFDDFYVGNIIVDQTAPTVLSVNAIAADSLKIQYSETVSSISTINYGVDNSIGSPVTAVADVNDPSVVYLTFTNSFVSGSYYNVSIVGIQDLAGNLMTDTTVNFSYYAPQTFDVVINEIMADPTPAVDLPEYEYVEIYNRSKFAIDLTGWTFTAGSTTKEIGSVSIDSNSYAILIDIDAAWLYTGYGTVIGVDAFPSITNDGQTLVLRNADGKMISTVSYTTDTYKDDAKKDGGWTLEQIDPNNPCGGDENWRASIGTKGGTPCTQNSVYSSNGDQTSPELNRISVIDSVNIQLFFP